jgi:hypothetical protein
MAASKPLASAELVDAGEWAAARGTGELAETLGSIEQPKRYNDKAQSNDKEQRTLNPLRGSENRSSLIRGEYFTAGLE